MAARSIASLSLTFGLVSIPIKLYSATESSSAIRFKLMAPGGARVRQQYVADALPVQEPEPEPAPSTPPKSSRGAKGAALAGASERVLSFPTRLPALLPEQAPPAQLPELEEPVARSEMLKGYEFEKGQFVLFTPEELKSLEAESRQTIDIVSFIPERAVDPLYYDKPYFLAPDKRGAKPYSLLLKAMQETGRTALAKWAWRSKEYVVQVRPTEGGLVLQQLLYSDEVRSLADLDVDLAPVSAAELALAVKIVEQISEEAYDPAAFVDEEKQRILAAVERKIAGKQIVAHDRPATLTAGAEVVDLMDVLRASLNSPARVKKTATTEARARMPARRADSSNDQAQEPKRKVRK